jgi:hypothetical protein
MLHPNAEPEQPGKMLLIADLLFSKNVKREDAILALLTK